MGKRLLALGLVTEIDGAALAAYCQTWARWLDAEQQISQRGTVWKLTNTHGQPYIIQSPYLQVANKALEQMMRFLVEFGMSPASRSRVRATPPGGVEEDPLEEFLRGNERRVG